jgi:hypothetical protein
MCEFSPRAKMEGQIVSMAKELHKQDIVWRDVHPGHVVIDVELYAWIVDFEGGLVERFVDQS